MPQHPRVHLSPTAGRRAAAVRPRSPATAPRPGSSSTPQPTYCGPLSRRSSPLVPGHSAPSKSSLVLQPTYCGLPSHRSSPSVPGHSAPTRVVVPLRTHPLRAAEPQQFALGSRPQRPDRGRRSSPNPPTVGCRAAAVRPQSPAKAPRPGSLFVSVPTHCGPPSQGKGHGPQQGKGYGPPSAALPSQTTAASGHLAPMPTSRPHCKKLR